VGASVGASEGASVGESVITMLGGLEGSTTEPPLLFLDFLSDFGDLVAFGTFVFLALVVLSPLSDSDFAFIDLGSFDLSFFRYRWTLISCAEVATMRQIAMRTRSAALENILLWLLLLLLLLLQ